MGRGFAFGTTLPETYRRIPIRNGPLNPDGTVNEERAAELVWKLRPEGETSSTRSGDRAGGSSPQRFVKGADIRVVSA